MNRSYLESFYLETSDKPSWYEDKVELLDERMFNISNCVSDTNKHLLNDLFKYYTYGFGGSSMKTDETFSLNVLKRFQKSLLVKIELSKMRPDLYKLQVNFK